MCAVWPRPPHSLSSSSPSSGAIALKQPSGRYTFCDLTSCFPLESSFNSPHLILIFFLINYFIYRKVFFKSLMSTHRFNHFWHCVSSYVNKYIYMRICLASRDIQQDVGFIWWENKSILLCNCIIQWWQHWEANRPSSLMFTHFYNIYKYLIPHMRDNRWNSSFCVWLISHSIRIFSPTHFVVNVSIYFLWLSISQHVIISCFLFGHPSVVGQPRSILYFSYCELCCNQHEKCRYFWYVDFILFGDIPRSGIVKSYSRPILIF